MTISKDVLIERVDKYLGEVLVGKLKGSANKFMIGFIRPVLPTAADRMGVWRWMETIGCLSDRGVDMDLLGKCVRSGFSSVSTVTVMGLTIDLEEMEQMMGFVCANDATA